MPKLRKRVGHGRQKLNAHRKFRIGNRKSGRAGHEMSNDELLDVVNKSSRSRDAQKALKVLQEIRGVKLVPIVNPETFKTTIAKAA